MPRTKNAGLIKYLTYAFVPASFIYLLIGFNQGLNVYDEGLAVYGATSVMRGEMLYKDFWTGYGPAHFYVMAGLFKLFGTSIIVERIATVCFMWLMSFTAYLMARRLVAPGLALLAWVVIVIRAFGIVSGFPPPMPNIMTLSFLSCLCLFNYMSSKRVHWLMLSGFVAGLVAVFRHDFGVYAMLAGMFISAVFAVACLHPERTGIARRLLRLVKIEACYLMSAGAVIVPVAALVLARVPRQEVIFPLAVVPLKLYARYFSLPYPRPPSPQLFLNGSMSLSSYVLTTLATVPFWFPILIFGIATIVIANRDWRVDTMRLILQWLPASLVLLLGVEFWNYARIRSDLQHVLPTFTASVLMFVFLLQHVVRSGKFRVPVYALTALVCFSIALIPLREKTALARGMMARDSFSFTVERGRGIHPGDNYAEYEGAVRYIQERTGRNERIFVGGERHDRLRTNDAMFYVLSERRSATRYVELHRAVACTRPCQQEIVRDMRANHVRYVVLREDNRTEPNASRFSSGVTILDDFIRNGYDPVATFGAYMIWQRKEVTAVQRS